MVFAGLFPIDADDYKDLRDALDKLRLNDSSFTYEPETSAALGFGFRCGFLGLLHMEIIQERLEREFNLELYHRPPVRYRVTTTGGEMIEIDSPAQLPDPGRSTRSRSRSSRRRSHRRRVRRQHPHALPGQARHPEGPPLRHDDPRPDRVRAAADRDHPRLLRQAEVGLARLRLPRLRAHRYRVRRSSSSTSWSTASRSTPSRSSSTGRRPSRAASRCREDEEMIPRQLFEVASRRRSARRSSRARP